MWGETYGKILVITSSYDLTVDYIIDKFNDNLNFFRLNTDKLDDYNIKVYNDGWKISNDFYKISENETLSIYYRKPVLPDISFYPKKYHRMMYKEILTLIEGIVNSFEGKCLTKPIILKRADNKIIQLKAAKKVGFNIPQSLITNSNVFADEFIKKSKAIVKPISVGKINYKDKTGRDKIGIIQTNLVNKNIEFDGLELSPAYFQSYITKDYELRVTVVNKKFYSIKIETDDDIDWRKSDDIKYSFVCLPNNIKRKCLEFMKIFNLNYGAFDFIVSDGKYIF